MDLIKTELVKRHYLENVASDFMIRRWFPLTCRSDSLLLFLLPRLVRLKALAHSD